jgi:hypothetical protein
MEWVFVTYPGTRDVFIDGRRSGQTNRLLIVGEGTYQFDLGLPVDYRPRKRVVTVTDTTPDAPMMIEFALSP